MPIEPVVTTSSSKAGLSVTTRRVLMIVRGAANSS
jgi:hypothetical protein